jgi:multidrug resistance efflux pump
MRNLGAIASLLLAAAPGCAPPAATAADRVLPAGELKSLRGAFQDRLFLTGELQAVQAEKIMVPRTPVWTLPIRWIASDGSWVARGEKVLELDNSQFTAELEQKELALSGAHNDLARKEAEVGGRLAELEFTLDEKRIALDKARIDAEIPQDIRPEREWHEAQLAVRRAEAAHDKALTDLEANRRAAEAELEELRIALRRASEEIETARRAIDLLTLLAPREGILIVAENRGEGRKFQVGDSVWVGLEVMRIPELSEMKVLAKLSDVDDGKVTPGMPVRVSLDIAPGRVYEGSVAEISPVAQEENNRSLRRSFQVTIRLDESDPAVMRPGLSVRAEVLTSLLDGVVTVPRAALDWDGTAPHVLLADGSAVEVELGPCDALRCVVERGLEPDVRLRVGA